MKSQVVLFFALLWAFFSCKTKVVVVDSCGDGFLDPGEECDTGIGDNTCLSLGYYRTQGVLVCTNQCRFDASDCGGRCGDNTVDVDSGEQCDGVNLNGASCQTLGASGGDLSCTAGCRFDISGCLSICGNGLVENEEDCDDANHTEGDGCTGCTVDAGWSCTGQPSLCEPVCGDGLIVGEEPCDGVDLNGRDCGDLGQYPGILSCSATCEFDTSGCGGTCGDNAAQILFGEDCDGADLAGQDCTDHGYYFGNLACTGQCAWDTTGCSGSCGDGILQTQQGEMCDGENLGNAKCLDVGFFFGTPGCGTDCQPVVGDCSDTRLFGGPFPDSGEKVVVDSVGNVLVVGTRDPGTMYMMPLLRKYDANGVLQWDYPPSQMGLTRCNDLAVDASGNIYLACTEEVETAEEVFTPTMLLVKISPSGTLVWTRLMEMHSFNKEASAVVVAPDGSVYMAGYTGGSFDGQTYLGNNDAVLVKYDSSGTRQWTRILGTDSNDGAHGLAVDASGNVYMVGHANAAMQGQTHFGGSDVFMAKYNPEGTRQWLRQWGSTENDVGHAVALDSDGNVHVTGFVWGTMHGQAAMGNADVFLTRYSAAAVFQWTRLWGTAGMDIGQDVKVTADGDILVVGVTTGSLQGQANSGLEDIFLTRYNASGDHQSTRLFGTGQFDAGRGLAVHPSGGVFITGATEGMLNGQASLGNMDIFLMYVP